jgi:uncharacterized protein (DUF1697 family)
MAAVNSPWSLTALNSQSFRRAIVSGEHGSKNSDNFSAMPMGWVMASSIPCDRSRRSLNTHEPDTIAPMRYVAFLRGINVGGRNIKMADLTACFDEMDFDNVTTVLQSGNVIFDSAKSLATLKRTIEIGLNKKFDYPAHVQVFALKRLEQIIAASPFDDSDPQLHSYVVFFEDGLEKQLAVEVSDVDNQFERIEVGDGVIYWQVPKGSTLQSDFARYLTKARYRDFHTNRNITTLRKIVK